MENTNYHNVYAIRNGHIGIIQLWKWANCYRFIDFENNKVFKISYEKIHKLTFLSNEEFNKLYKEKNKPSNLFHEDSYFIGEDKSLYSDRQISYGLIHDNLLHAYEKQTNSYWTNGFCMAVASSIASYYYLEEALQINPDLEKIDRTILLKLLKKYHMSNDESDMYTIILKRILMLF